jgi:hypothetical protein
VQPAERRNIFLHRTGETRTLGDADPAAECEFDLGTLDSEFAHAGAGLAGHRADCLA